MSDVKKIATREAYGKTLVELGAEMPNLVVLDADLAGSTKTGEFQKVYPDRFFDCGIAEGNMMSIAVASRQLEWYLLPAVLLCSREAALTSRSAIPSAIRA